VKKAVKGRKGAGDGSIGLDVGYNTSYQAEY